MKTYILRLEPHDDLVSTRDKMGWAKDSRILLVWPENKALLNRRLDLILLQRHSRSLGSQLALVTRDPEVHYFAPRLGIPVFRSLHKAQGQHWRVPRRFRRFQEMADRPDLQGKLEDNRSDLQNHRDQKAKGPGSPLDRPSKTIPCRRWRGWSFFWLGCWRCWRWQPAWRPAPGWC